MAHLDRHGGPIVQLRPVHLRQAGGGDGLVVERLEKLTGAQVEVLLEERLHLAAEAAVRGVSRPRRGGLFFCKVSPRGTSGSVPCPPGPAGSGCTRGAAGG